MKQYQIIVVDPPWEVKKITHPDRPNQVNMDYPLMSLNEIKSLKIGGIADDKSLCFLWTTQKYLYDAKSISEGWGFKHLLTMVWEKTFGKSAGMPLYGFRWNAEFILVGYKHSPALWIKGKPLIPACFQAENNRHSEKPNRFYDMIETLGEPRIDLFARRKRFGWDCIGNDIDGVDIREALNRITQE